MDSDIELISDGDGLAVIGEPAAVERFLASEGLASKSLDLPRLSTVLSSGSGAAQAGAEIAAASGRWVKLTKQSAELMQKYPLMKGSDSGVARAIVTQKGKTKHIVEFVKPGSVLTSPAMLAGAAGLMAQLAMQQAMDEITDYLKVIDAKVDDVLRGQKDAVLAAMIGVESQIDDAMVMREESGRIGSITWSKIDGAEATIAQTQAYALRQLEGLADKLESTTQVGELGKVARGAEVTVREWLAVLARCFQLLDALAVLELDRVLDESPHELDRHRVGLRAARQKRLDKVAARTRDLLARMDTAAGTANAKVLLHPTASRVVDSRNRVATSVIDFEALLGIESDRSAVERRRWLDAASDVKDKALATGADGVEVTKRLGDAGLSRARTVGSEVRSGLTSRLSRVRRDDSDG